MSMLTLLKEFESRIQTLVDKSKGLPWAESYLIEGIKKLQEEACHAIVSIQQGNVVDFQL